MILVTGATGKLGEAVIDYLIKRIPVNQVVGLTRGNERTAALTAKGIQVRRGDYFEEGSLLSAFRGIDKLLLVSSVAFTDGFTQHKNVIHAAKNAGVKRIVYTSIQRTGKTGYSIPWVTDSSQDTEKYLAASGLDYTIVRNTFYADNLPYWIGNDWKKDGITIPAGNGRVPYATRDNLAEAISNILTTDGHTNKTYTLTNTETWSFADIAHLLTELSGAQITYRNVSAEEFIDRIVKTGFPESLAIFWTQWAEAFNQGYMDQVHGSLERLLGRKPTSLKDFLRTAW